MPKKIQKRERLVTYIPTDVMRQCKASAAAQSMSPSEYAAAVLCATFGRWTPPPITPPTTLSNKSLGAAQSSRVTGATGRGATTAAVSEMPRESKDEWLLKFMKEVDAAKKELKPTEDEWPTE